MIDGLLSNITGFIIALNGTIDGVLTPPGAQAPPAATTTVTDAATTVTTYATPPAGGEGIGMMWMVVYAGVLIVAMYFLMFRGPRKREKKARELQASLRAGDNVVVTGGMFGRIADVGEDSFIVEFGTNRGIRIPVLKSDVLGVREPKLTPPPKVESE